MPVLLFNGESVVDLMIEKGLGVERDPLYAFYERPGFLAEEPEHFHDRCRLIRGGQ